MKLNIAMAIGVTFAMCCLVQPLSAQQGADIMEWETSQLDDCTDEALQSSIGTSWELVTDNDRGGGSRLTADGSGDTLAISGNLKRGGLFGGPGTAGIFLPLDETLAEHNINSWDGIRVRIRRSGAPVLLRVHGMEIANGDHFAADIPASDEFETYEFPFSRMGQVMSPQQPWDGTRVTGVELMSWSFPSAEFSFELDSISFYRNN